MTEAGLPRITPLRPCTGLGLRDSVVQADPMLRVLASLWAMSMWPHCFSLPSLLTVNAILIICHYLLCPHYITARLHNGLSRVFLVRYRECKLDLSFWIQCCGYKVQGVLLGLFIHKYIFMHISICRYSVTFTWPQFPFLSVSTGQQTEVGGCVCAPASLPRLTPDYLLMPRASRSMLVANNKVDTAHTEQWAWL